MIKLSQRMDIACSTEHPTNAKTSVQNILKPTRSTWWQSPQYINTFCRQNAELLNI